MERAFYHTCSVTSVITNRRPDARGVSVPTFIKLLTERSALKLHSYHGNHADYKFRTQASKQLSLLQDSLLFTVMVYISHRH